MKRNLSVGYSGWNGFGVKLFSDDELESIHLSTLEIMEKTGLYFESDEALDLLESGGANVDRDSHIAKIPSYIVEEAIRTAPKNVLLAGRDPKNDFILERGRVNVCPFGQGVAVLDPYTGEYRPSTIKDLADATRLVDALDQYDMNFDLVAPQDVDPRVAVFHDFEAQITNTSKHIVLPAQDKKGIEVLLEMGAAVAGGRDKLRERPIFQIGACPISPLSYPKEQTDTIIEFAKAEVPCHVLSMAMAGGMGPVTLAGAVVTHNAEVLAGLVISQLAKAGAPFIYASSTGMLWLKKASAIVGCPELGMISAAVASLARYYLLPSLVAGT